MTKEKTKKSFFMLGALVAVLVCAATAFSVTAAPAAGQIAVSAYIVGSSGTDTTVNGDYQVRFAIYSTNRTTADPYPSNADAGKRLWTETQKVHISDGILDAYLGSATPLPASLNFTSGDYYLGIQIGQDSEMVPRKKIGAVPLSLQSLTSQTAQNALTLNGSVVGTGSGNIPTLGSGGKMNIAELPTGTSGKTLMLANDSRLSSLGDIHVQNTDTGTNANSFTIGLPVFAQLRQWMCRNGSP